MRQWAAPIGFVGAAASLVFWIAVPLTSTDVTTQVGGVFCAVLAALSALGVAGALMAPVSRRLSPALMALAIVPAIGALLIPGVLVVIATILAVQEFSDETGVPMRHGGAR